MEQEKSRSRKTSQGLCDCPDDHGSGNGNKTPFEEDFIRQTQVCGETG